MPMFIYDAIGAAVWDTDSVAGGILADTRTYAAGATATLTYPAFPGRQVLIIPLMSGVVAGALNVTADTLLGYPRVTVGSSPTKRRFSVMVL